MTFFLKLQKAKSLLCSKSLVMSLYKRHFVRDTNIFFSQSTCVKLCLHRTDFLPKSSHSKVFPLLYVNRKMHSGMKTYGCELCGKSFLDSLRLRMHLLSHSGKEIKPAQNPKPHTMNTVELYLFYHSWVYC